MNPIKRHSFWIGANSAFLFNDIVFFALNHSVWWALGAAWSAYCLMRSYNRLKEYELILENGEEVFDVV